MRRGGGEEKTRVRARKKGEEERASCYSVVMSKSERVMRGLTCGVSESR